MSCRLNDVLEYAEDIEIDIPKIWDYLGEILASALIPQGVISLRILSGVPQGLVTNAKAAKLVAKTFHSIQSMHSVAEVSKVWAESQLEWSALGVNAGEEAEFLSGQVAPTPHLTVT